MVPIPTRVWRTTSTSSTNASSGEQPRRPTNTPTARSITLREVLSERSIRFPIFASHYIGLPGNCGAKHWGLNYRSTSRQLAAFIQQRIRHVYRRHWPAPLPSRTAKSRHQSQLGVDGLDVANARSVGRRGRLAVVRAMGPKTNGYTTATPLR